MSLDAVGELLRQAQRLIGGGQVALAVRVLERARGLAPEEPQVLLALGTTLLVERRRTAAAAVLQDLAVRTEDPAALFDLARLLTAAEDPEGALAVLEKARTLASASRFAALLRSQLAEVRGLADRLNNARRPDPALAALRLAALALPEDCGIQEALLEQQLRLGDLKGAVGTLAAVRPFEGPDERAVFDRYRHLCDWMAGALAETPARAARLATGGTGKPFLVHATVAWGADYVPLCARHLRCLAAPGNMPALSRRFDLRIALVTTEADFAALQATGALELFRDICPIEPIFLPAEVVRRDEHLRPTSLMYYVFSMALHACIDLARALGAAISPLAVDTVFADGAYGRLAEMAAEGWEALCITSMVCRRESFLADLDARFPDTRAPIRLAVRDLMGMIAGHLHDVTRCAFVSPSNPDFSCPPGVLFWRHGTDVVGHGFCLDPVYVSAAALARYRSYRFTSVDGHLAANIFPSREDWHRVRVIADADDFAMLSLTSERQAAATIGRPFDLRQARLYKTVGSLIAPFNEWVFRHPMTFRGVFPPGSPDEYDPALIGAILGDDGLPPQPVPGET